jgi:cation transport regulator ChaC
MTRDESTPSTLNLRAGEFAMFGYGSLLRQSSMELTLGRRYTGPRIPCELVGWRRTWDVIMPNRSFFERTVDGDFTPLNIIYLNVTPAVGRRMNGILYIISEEELALFDQREWIYDRHAIEPFLRGVQVEGGEAYVYQAKPEWLLSPERDRSWAALRRSYIEIVERGLEELGPEFRQKYDESTDPVPAHLVFADEKRGDTHPSLADRAPSGLK